MFITTLIRLIGQIAESFGKEKMWILTTLEFEET